MTSGWVSALDPVHATRARVRWRYACRQGAPLEAHALERAVATVDRVRKVRGNAAARAIAVEFDAALTSADRIALEILCMVPAQARKGGVHNGESSIAPVALSAATLLVTRSLQPGLLRHCDPAARRGSR